jgi:hypothetical protein
MKSSIVKIFTLLILINSIITGQAPDTNFKNIEFKQKEVITSYHVPLWLKSRNTIYEEPNPLYSQVDYWKLAGIGVITLGVGTAIHIYQANAWWQDQGSKFRVINDWEYALWIDKVGHFYGAHLLGHAFSAGFEAANMDAEKSTIYAAAAALAFQLYVEVEDGFGANWGFSPGDVVFDVLGSAYFLAQYYYPYLKNFQPRASYYPSEQQRKGLRPDGNIIDDYDGQKYWLAVRMKEVLPKNIAEYWPSFLMLSVGMGVKNIRTDRTNARSDLYFAFDLDVEKLPLHGKFWQFIKNTLNYLHFPMPGVRITSGVAFFGLVY